MTLSTATGNASQNMPEMLGRRLTMQVPSKTISFHIPKTFHRSNMLGEGSKISVTITSRKVVCRDSTNKVTNHPQNSKRSRWLKDDDCVRTSSTAASDLSTLSSSGKSNMIAPTVAINSSINDIAKLRPASGDSRSCDGTSFQAPPRKLLQVAVDVDEVLGSFLSSLNAFIEEEHALEYTTSQYHVYDFMKIWCCSQSEANDRVHAFFESDHFKDGIQPIPGAYESLLQLAGFCHLVIVTSRQHVIKNQTLDWIERHYPGVFQDIYFGNHFALEGEARPKSEICRSIGAEILIDDNPRYAMECAQHGIEVLLFDHKNSYPWSKTADGPVHPLITRVRDWDEVGVNLLARAYAKRDKLLKVPA